MNFVRQYVASDLGECINIFNRSIREVAIRDYSRRQVAAWAPAIVDTSSWAERLSSALALVYVHMDQVLGFIRIEGNHLDMLFVHPAYQRQGIARALFRHAVMHGPHDLTADVSVTARPFFEAIAFRVVKSQFVERYGVKIKNFRMHFNGDLADWATIQPNHLPSA